MDDDVEVLALSEKGVRCGASSPGARLTDHEVELIEDLVRGGMPSVEAARKFGVSPQLVCDILHGRRRNIVPAKWVVIRGQKRTMCR